MSVNNHLSLSNFVINLQKIEQTILFIQKKIYIASKACKISQIHYLQINFLTNKYYRILFIQQILKYINWQRLFSHNYYLKLFIYIYTNINIKKEKSIFINYLQEQLSKDLIFFVLQPEWSARFEKFTCFKQRSINSYKFQKRINKFLKYSQNILMRRYLITLNISISSKFIHYQYIHNKIQSIKLISSKLNVWFNLYNFIDYNDKKIDTKVINEYNKLYKLLEKILYIGIEWQLYISFKTKNIYKTIIPINKNEITFIKCSMVSKLKNDISSFMYNLCLDFNYLNYKKEKQYNNSIVCKNILILKQVDRTCTIKISNYSAKLLLRSIRSILYDKNQFNQWRLKRYLAAAVAKLKIEKILYVWNQNYINSLDDKQLSRYNLMINKIFCNWQIKK